LLILSSLHPLPNIRLMAVRDGELIPLFLTGLAALTAVA
jgi:hypothetical protein